MKRWIIKFCGEVISLFCNLLLWRYTYFLKGLQVILTISQLASNAFLPPLHLANSFSPGLNYDEFPILEAFCCLLYPLQSFSCMIPSMNSSHCFTIIYLLEVCSHLTGELVESFESSIPSKVFDTQKMCFTELNQ